MCVHVCRGRGITCLILQLKTDAALLQRHSSRPTAVKTSGVCERCRLILSHVFAAQSQFNSFTMTVWYCYTSCPPFPYQWHVRRRDPGRGSAPTQGKERGANVHIHQCANPKCNFKNSFFFSFFFKTSSSCKPLNFSTNNQNIDPPIWLETVISHPDRVVSWLE